MPFFCNILPLKQNVQNVKPDWSQLFEHFGDDLYRFAYRLSSSREIAEDAVQECFVSCLKSNPLTTQIRGEMRAYLFGAVRNQVYKALKRNPPPPEAKPILVQPDQTSEVFAALQQISESSREALVLVCIEGFSYDEAARMLDVEPSALRVRVHRARRQLKEVLGIEVNSND